MAKDCLGGIKDESIILACRWGAVAALSLELSKNIVFAEPCASPARVWEGLLELLYLVLAM